MKTSILKLNVLISNSLLGQCFLTLSIVFLLNQNTSAQCTLTNYNSGDCSGICTQNGIIGGQSFLACDSGELEEIMLDFTGSGTDNRFVLRFYEGTGFDNLIWTSQEYTIVSFASPTIYELSIGTGNKNVVAGNTYSFSIEYTGDLIFDISACHFLSEMIDPYPDGVYLRCNGAPSFLTSIIRDLVFDIAINGASLPVKLIEFKAEAQGAYNQIYWSTESEVNNSGFELQKSRNARDWQTIEFMAGKGTTSEVQEYYYQDFNPLEGFNYYRLMQIDYNGATEYSDVITVDFQKYKEEIRVSPNPVSNYLSIQGLSDYGQNYSIYNTSSQLIKIGQLSEGRVDLSNLQTGLYLLMIETENGMVTKRVFKD